MNSRTLISHAVGALLVAMASTPVLAQTDTTRPAAATADAGAKATLGGADRQFVERAASGGLTEVEMGKMAQQKAANDQVKLFAARMVQDHTMANEELKRLAQSKGVAIPAAPSKDHHGDQDKLSKLSGLEFDRQYMAHMVSDHRKTVAEFKKASESAKDVQVKDFATKTLPKLQEHLAQAQSINESVKSATR